MATVVAKNVIPKREKGVMYFVKGTNLMKATMNRKGGKKGVKRRTLCSPKKKSTTKKKTVAKKKTTKKKAAPKKKAVKKTVNLRAKKKTTKKKTTKRK